MGVTQTLLYITCLCLARDLVSCDNYEETGKDITLTPSIRGHPTDILWTHNGNKVLEYDGSEMMAYGSFRGRVVVDFETGELTIRKLNSPDSGQYQSDIEINGKVQTSIHTVTVLDALPEPQVTCELSESSNASKKLLCSVESQTQPSYEWSGPNINVKSGPELLVDEQEENRDSVYTCTVKNQVNSKSADFTLKDCPIGRVGSTVLIPVLIVTILLLILLILLAIFIYRRKKQNLHGLEARLFRTNQDPENGEDQNLLKKDPTDVMTGSSDATLPSRNRLPRQSESIAYKKWDQDNGSENSVEEQKLLKENFFLLEHNPTQSPQSGSETNQEDKEHGNEGELAKNEKNSESAVEAEEKPYSKPDATEKKSHKSFQSQEEEEKERQMLKQESGNGEKSPEHQNESQEEQKTGDDNEDNQTPGETIDRRDTGEDQNLLKKDPTDVMTGSSDATLPSPNILPRQSESIAYKKWDQDNGSENPLLEHNPTQSPQSGSETNQEDKEHGNEGELAKNEKNSESAVEAEEKPYSKPDATEKKSHKSFQSQEEEEKERQMLKQESGNGEKSPEHQNESQEEQKTGDDNEDNQTPGETIDRRDTGTETENPQSAVTERNNMDTEKEEGQLHENEKKSQSDDGEPLPEQQTENKQKTEDEDDMKPGEQNERSQEKNQEEIDRANTAEPCNGPAADGEAPSAPAAHLEEEPTNSSASSSNQTDISNHTDQNKEEEIKRPGLEKDEEETAITNQEQKDGQKQTAEEKDHDPDKSEGESSDEFDKQADPDCTKNSSEI